MAAETISAVGTVVAAALAAFTAWRAERITAGATRERQREQWRRVRGAARLVNLELTSASLPLRRLLRDYEDSLTALQPVGDAGVRLMRVSRVAWTEHQPLLADRLKPDPARQDSKLRTRS